MKYFLILLMMIPVIGISQSSDATLTTQANVIRNETTPSGNTKGRVADMFQGLIDSKASILGSYSNPSWITSLPWSKISSAPSFLTSESDPVYSGSSWFSTTNNSSDWNTAFGWGDHSTLYWQKSGTTVVSIPTIRSQDAIYFNMNNEGNSSDVSTLTLQYNKMNYYRVAQFAETNIPVNLLELHKQTGVVGSAVGTGASIDFGLTLNDNSFVYGDLTYSLTNSTPASAVGEFSFRTIKNSTYSYPLKINSTGAYYSTDLSSGYTSRHLIDKGYADATYAPVGTVGLSDGDKGDITVSGSGATWSVDSGVISLSKMADVSTSTVFYRKTAGSGSPEAQTLSTLKTDLGLTGTNTGDQTSIVGITGSLSEFNTALTGADFATGGGTATGTNTGDQTITLTGAVTGSGTGSFATTIATPGTLTVSSTNSTATAHTHAVTSSNSPGAAASILATDASGHIGTTGSRIVKGWFTDLQVTNSISGSITGSAATLTTSRNIQGVSFNGSANIDIISGTGFVKASGTTLSYDNSTYLTANQSITLSGDISGTGSTAITTSIGSNKVTNSMLSTVATATFKGRTTGGTGNVEDLTVTQATALLNAVVGDSGSGGTKGLVPAPSSGDASSGKFLKADGTWSVPASSGGQSFKQVLGVAAMRIF